MDIHDYAAEVPGSEKEDPAFISWISDVVGKLAVSDEVHVHWGAKASPLSSRRRPSGEQYVAILDAGGATLGVIEMVGNLKRQAILGPCCYSAQELNAVAELGKHIGAFLENDQALRAQRSIR